MERKEIKGPLPIGKNNLDKEIQYLNLPNTSKPEEETAEVNENLYTLPGFSYNFKL